jgi:REP element-mobilizing transposase RayT
MAQSLSNLHVHLIFSTKNRHPWLAPEWRADVWRYLAGAFDGQKCHALKIGGVADHVHALFDLHRTVALSEVVGQVKAESSKWIKQEKGVTEFSWQAGYGAFAVRASNLDQVMGYIARQEHHHAKTTFQDEFRLFLERHRVAFDERYVWD